MSKQSAGILLYRIVNDHLEVFLVHPGGPFWTKKDSGAWSIPKGEFENEDPLVAAQREFLEEIGIPIDGETIALTPQKQKGGKVIYLYAELLVVGTGTAMFIVRLFYSLLGDPAWFAKLGGLSSLESLISLIPVLSIIYLLGILMTNGEPIPPAGDLLYVSEFRNRSDKGEFRNLYPLSTLSGFVAVESIVGGDAYPSHQHITCLSLKIEIR